MTDAPAGTTVGDLVRWGGEYLTKHDIPAPHIDVEVLLARVLAVERTDLHIRPERQVSHSERAEFTAFVERRAEDYPLAYILGEWEFYGVTLEVTEAVLVPRPDTELVVERALLACRERERPLRVVDVCTGSGCIITALAVNLAPPVELCATEISSAAAAVARRNFARNDIAVDLHEGDLLEPVAGSFDLIVSNPPYVATNDPALADNVRRFEPALALRDTHDGDGLGFYRRLANEATPRLNEHGALIVEVGETQARDVAALFAAAGLTTEVYNDLAGIERVVVGRLG